ncbi:S8 family peptidase [Alkalicoccobacillus murimartini]|uniref:Serine protease AprX n=1 Tax=Alkalicoccobacillus murimartini TaxID=171685 RepID=A0ABT9YED6_9BACI|nr:S8 family peptidase [Alkalicoccobacillus murimartini]MDQ0206197.1 serine protease AprX [Alkalicoccobacillus murimartini]
MFHYSMVKLVRSHSEKLDKPLREAIISLYKPFRFTPCFIHQFLEKRMKKKRKLSVIIEFKKTPNIFSSFVVEQLLEGSRYCRVNNKFAAISCCSASITPERLEFILIHCNEIKRVYLNRTIKALSNHWINSKFESNRTTDDERLTGKGVTVAVIDTGVYLHEDLEGRVRDFVDFINQRTKAYDDNGHGTHCAGNVAGNGSMSNGDYKGVAIEAEIIGVKVLDRTGTGTLESIIQGVDWCIKYNQIHPDRPIDIISMSLGTHALKYKNEQEDPVVRMVEEAWMSGITVVTAAGNDGPDAYTIASPGVSDKIITVGALDSDHQSDGLLNTAAFSSRGPTIYGKAKPDILAPGVNSISLRSPGSMVDRTQKSNRIKKHYTKMSGTSMSTPLCAGAAALLIQNDRTLSPNEIKKLLMQETLSSDRDQESAQGPVHLDIAKSLYDISLK